jgi:hypothetical protein
MASQDALARPEINTSPSVGSNSRLMSFKMVVFPDPLRPSRTKVSPVETCRFRPEMM